MSFISTIPFHLNGFHLVSSVVTFRRPRASMCFHLRFLLFLLCASFCLRVHSLSTADITRHHPALAQNVNEFIHPRDFPLPHSAFFIEDSLNENGIPGREREYGDLYYRNERFDVSAMSAAAEDIMKSSTEGYNFFNGAFNIYQSYFQISLDNTQTHGGFSYETRHQCLAIHTPYREFPNSSKLTRMDHFELVNALFVVVDSDTLETESGLRSFAYVEIDDDTGRPVFCGNTRVRASQILQPNLTSPLFDNHDPLQLNCSIEQTLEGLVSFCLPNSPFFGTAGGWSVRTTIPSEWKTIDWSQRAINASQVGTSSLILTKVSLPSFSAVISGCGVACFRAKDWIRQRLAEDNPGPITRSTAIALVLVPALLGLLLTILEMVLVITTSVIKRQWGKWVIFGLTLLDFGLVALAIIAAAVELPKMNVPLIYSSWYTAGDSNYADAVNVSSPIGDLQLEMWLLGEELDAQWSLVEARNITIVGLVLSCMNVVAFVVPPLIHKVRHYVSLEKTEKTDGE